METFATQIGYMVMLLSAIGFVLIMIAVIFQTMWKYGSWSKVLMDWRSAAAREQQAKRKAARAG